MAAPGGRTLGRLASLFVCFRLLGWFGVTAGVGAPAALACWDEAARRYGVSSALLYAIAQTESSLNPQAIGHNRNGSRDIGLMQINSWWLPRLAVYGLHERHLFDPCTNVHIGAWILAGNLHRMRDPWEAVGAYHARDPQRRRAYVQRIQRRLAMTAAGAHPSQSALPQSSRSSAVRSASAHAPVSSSPRTFQELP